MATDKKTATAGTKKEKGLTYVGPDYGSAIHFPYIQRPQDPRSWPPEKTTEMIARYPELKSYFK